MLLVVREFYQLAWELVDHHAASCMGIGVLNGKTCCSCREFYLAWELQEYERMNPMIKTSPNVKRVARSSVPVPEAALIEEWHQLSAVILVDRR